MSGELPFVAHWRNAVRDSDLDQTAKLVAYTLSTFMNGHGVCWPARPTLAEACRCSVLTVDRAVVRVERAGLLAVERTKGGRGRSNRYVAILGNGFMGDAVSREKQLHRESETASPEVGNGFMGEARKRGKASEDVSTLADARERAPRAGKQRGRRARGAPPSSDWDGIEADDR